VDGLSVKTVEAKTLNTFKGQIDRECMQRKIYPAQGKTHMGHDAYMMMMMMEWSGIRYAHE
jgi:tRNA A58 N-methylase Trm61